MRSDLDEELIRQRVEAVRIDVRHDVSRGVASKILELRVTYARRGRIVHTMIGGC